MLSKRVPGERDPVLLLLAVTAAVLMLVLLAGATGCGGDGGTGRWFSYPPGSVPHLNDPDGKPLGRLFMLCSWSHVGSAPGSNQVWVRVQDRDDKVLLRDKFEVTGYRLSAEASWTTRESIELVVQAYSREDSSDGAKPAAVRRIRYIWDDAAGEYRRR